MTHGFDGRTDNTHWLTFRNVEAETVPPFAVMQVSGTETVINRTVLQCKQPDDALTAIYVTNGAKSVAPQKFGSCNAGRSCVALYKGDTPGNGEIWGPLAGQWELDGNGLGFVIFGTRVGGGLDLVEAVQSSSEPAISGQVRSNSTQSISDLLSHPIEFDLKQENGVNFDLATEEFEILVDGWYMLYSSFEVIATSGGVGNWGVITSFTSGFSVSNDFDSIYQLTGDNTNRKRESAQFSVIDNVAAGAKFNFTGQISGEAVDIIGAHAYVFRFGGL